MFRRPGKETLVQAETINSLTTGGVYGMGWAGYFGSMWSSGRHRLSKSYYLYKRKSTNFWEKLVLCQVTKFLRPPMRPWWPPPWNYSTPSWRNSSLLSRKHSTNTISSPYQHMMVCCHFNHAELTCCHDGDRTMPKIETRSKTGYLLSVHFVQETSQSFLADLKMRAMAGGSDTRANLMNFSVSVSASISLVARFMSISFFISDCQIHWEDFICLDCLRMFSQCTRRWKLEDGRGYSSGEVC